MADKWQWSPTPSGKNWQCTQLASPSSPMLADLYARADTNPGPAAEIKYREMAVLRWAESSPTLWPPSLRDGGAQPGDARPSRGPVLWVTHVLLRCPAHIASIGRDFPTPELLANQVVNLCWPHQHARCVNGPRAREVCAARGGKRRWGSIVMHAIKYLRHPWKCGTQLLL